MSIKVRSILKIVPRFAIIKKGEYVRAKVLSPCFNDVKPFSSSYCVLWMMSSYLRVYSFFNMLKVSIQRVYAYRSISYMSILHLIIVGTLGP